MWDIDELCMEYEELVEAGEIVPTRISLMDFLEDRISEMIDDALDGLDMER